MTTQSKWNDDRVKTLTDLAGPSGSTVSRETIAQAAEALEVSERSIVSKLAKIDGFSYTVEKVEQKKAFTDAESDALKEFVADHANEYTYATLAEAFLGGKFSSKAIQGKVLALKLTDLVNKAEKVAAPKTYTEDQEATLIELAKSGKSLEEAAEAVGKSVQSVRGKFLSLLREGSITNIPVQANKAAPKEDVFEGLDVSELTIDEIIAKLKDRGVEKTPRAIKQTLTNRGLSSKDYTSKTLKAASE